jgi:mono/diheme cytochrome c family protein
MAELQFSRGTLTRRVRIIGLLAVLLVVGVAAVVWIITAPRPAFSRNEQQALDLAGDADKGRLVFAAGDCASCHASPGQPDRLRLGGGLALSSPYGTFRVPNISPDPVDGIGTWHTVDLANALLSGVSPANAHYYPVFPYPSYTKMRLGDIRDLMAYLRTLPAVSGKPPPHDLSLPFNIRRFVAFWKILYLDRTPLPYDTARGEVWNRGRYLTEAVAHCAECHSSRNLFGAIKPITRFAGGTDPEEVGFIPNITSSRIGNWKPEEVAELLKSGVTPDHGRVGSSMAEVVTNTAMLPQDDRDAIAAFIKSLPARDTPRP